MTSSGCVFCRIIAGEAPAAFVYRDERVVAIMDRRPVSRGHTLVIPRVHVALLPALDEETGMHLFRVAMRLDAALREAQGVRAEAVRLSLSDGRAAGQEVPHVHLHLIPRYAGDVVGGGRLSATADDLARVAASIGAAYQRLFGEE